ncbi:MAG: FKBP-type peptidyl-prolyl cis-trans isomerase, partial [Desulfobacter sp.]
MSEAIKSGDTIAVDYTGKFESGDVFDSSEGRQPLT